MFFITLCATPLLLFLRYKKMPARGGQGAEQPVAAVMAD
jgi:hypothetical protein